MLRLAAGVSNSLEVTTSYNAKTQSRKETQRAASHKEQHAADSRKGRKANSYLIKSSFEAMLFYCIA